MPPKLTSRSSGPDIHRQTLFSHPDHEYIRTRIVNTPRTQPWHHEKQEDLFRIRWVVLNRIHSQCKLLTQSRLPPSDLQFIINQEAEIYQSSETYDEYVQRSNHKIAEISHTLGPKIRQHVIELAGQSSMSNPMNQPQRMMPNTQSNTPHNQQYDERFNPSTANLQGQQQNLHQFQPGSQDQLMGQIPQSQRRQQLPQQHQNQYADPLLSDDVQAVPRQIYPAAQGRGPIPQPPVTQKPRGPNSMNVELLQRAHIEVQKMRQTRPGEYQAYVQQARTLSPQAHAQARQIQVDPVAFILLHHWRTKKELAMQREQQEKREQQQQQDLQGQLVDHRGVPGAQGWMQSSPRPGAARHFEDETATHAQVGRPQQRPPQPNRLENLRNDYREQQHAAALQLQNGQVVVPASNGLGYDPYGMPDGTEDLQAQIPLNFSPHMSDAAVMNTQPRFTNSNNGGPMMQSSPLVPQNQLRGRAQKGSEMQLSPHPTAAMTAARGSPLANRMTLHQNPNQLHPDQQPRGLEQQSGHPRVQQSLNHPGLQRPQVRQPQPQTRPSPMVQQQMQANATRGAMPLEQRQTLDSTGFNPSVQPRRMMPHSQQDQMFDPRQHSSPAVSGVGLISRNMPPNQHAGGLFGESSTPRPGLELDPYGEGQPLGFEVQNNQGAFNASQTASTHQQSAATGPVKTQADGRIVRNVTQNSRQTGNRGYTPSQMHMMITQMNSRRIPDNLATQFQNVLGIRCETWGRLLEVYQGGRPDERLKNEILRNLTLHYKYLSGLPPQQSRQLQNPNQQQPLRSQNPRQVQPAQNDHLRQPMTQAGMDPRDSQQPKQVAEDARQTQQGVQTVRQQQLLRQERERQHMLHQGQRQSGPNAPIQHPSFTGPAQQLNVGPNALHQLPAANGGGPPASSLIAHSDENPQAAGFKQAKARAYLRSVISDAEVARARSQVPGLNEVTDDEVRLRIYNFKKREQAKQLVREGKGIQPQQQEAPTSMTTEARVAPSNDTSSPEIPRATTQGTKRPRPESVIDLSEPVQLSEGSQIIRPPAVQGESSAAENAVRSLLKLPRLPPPLIQNINDHLALARNKFSAQAGPHKLTAVEYNEMSAMATRAKHMVFSKLLHWIFFLAMEQERQDLVADATRALALLLHQYDEKSQLLKPLPSVGPDHFQAACKKLVSYYQFAMFLKKEFMDKNQKATLSYHRFMQRLATKSTEQRAPLNGTNLELMAKQEASNRSAVPEKSETKSQAPEAPVRSGKSHSRRTEPTAPTKEKAEVDWPTGLPRTGGADRPQYNSDSTKFGDLQLPAKKRKLNSSATTAAGPGPISMPSTAQAKIQTSTPIPAPVSVPSALDSGMVCKVRGCPNTKAGKSFATKFELDIHGIEAHQALDLEALVKCGQYNDHSPGTHDDLFGEDEAQPTATTDPLMSPPSANSLKECEVQDYDADGNFVIPESARDYDFMKQFDSLREPTGGWHSSQTSRSPTPGITPDRGTLSPVTQDGKKTPLKESRILDDVAIASEATIDQVENADAEMKPESIALLKSYLINFPHHSGDPNEPDEVYVIESDTEEQKKKMVGPVAATKARVEIVKKREEAEAARQLELKKVMKKNGWVGSTLLIDKEGREKAKEIEKTKFMYPWSSDGILPWNFQRDNLEPGHPYGPREEPEDEWDEGI